MSTRGWESVTMADMTRRELERAKKAAHTPAKARSKYGATKTTVDGITFDSAKEARRYQELLNLTRVGDIRELRVQPHYTLCALALDGPDLRDVNGGRVANRRVPVCEYVADFEYEQSDGGWGGVSWFRIVEDVKSPATRRKEVYRLKRKLFEAQYGVKIREV